MGMTPNSEIISWAINRAGKTIEDFVSISKYAAKWLTGEKVPTIKQLQKIADKTYVPLAYFYGTTTPKMTLQIPDFRTTYNGSAEYPSPELYETINLMQTRQDWLDFFLSDLEVDQIDFIGSYAGERDVSKVADTVKGILNLQSGWACRMEPDVAVRFLRSAIEAQGVYTCAGSYYHPNSRPYNVDEFRGFVLANDRAPIIFINTRDSKSAQLFTLLHEFAHLLFNESGVDDMVYETPEKEDLCDSVAAQVLVPEHLVYGVFDQMSGEQAIDEIKHATKASEIVCLRRAYELNRISKDDYFRIYGEYKARLKAAPASASKPSAETGPGYYKLKKSNLGKLFVDAIFEGIKSEKLMYKDAYSLTDMKAGSFEEFYKREGMLL